MLYIVFRIWRIFYSNFLLEGYAISTVDLSYVVPVKYTVEISQNSVAFSEYMNFKLVLKSQFFDNNNACQRVWNEFL